MGVTRCAVTRILMTGLTALSSIRIRDQDTMSHFTVYKKTQNSL